MIYLWYMQLKTLSGGIPYIFDATFFRNKEHQELMFLVTTQDGDIILAQRSGPKYEWCYVGGEKTSFLLRAMIFEAIDKAFIQDFLEDERPFEELNSELYNMLRNNPNL